MKQVWVSLLLVLTAIPLAAQRHRREPLSDPEIDQLREAAQDSQQRMHLFVKFARARMTAIEQLRGDPKLAEGRGARIHDLLEDLTTLEDEVTDNLSAYSDKQQDMRKAVKEIIEMDSEFQVKLRAIREATDEVTKKESQEYRFALQDALEAVNSSADTAREVLEEQNKLAKEKKFKSPPK
jgi:DNA repair exonuclease SbcCD ATPase subunit